MAKIIPLSSYKEQCAIQEGYRYWQTLFDGDFDAATRLPDLFPDTLYYLAEPGNDSATALYALIFGFSGYGASATFESLNSKSQSHVLDVFLFVSDQIRFEMMMRLRWLEQMPGREFSLYETVTDIACIKPYCQAHPPTLARDYADYGSYADLIERDQQVFIRRMFAEALQAFKHDHQLR